MGLQKQIIHGPGVHGIDHYYLCNYMPKAKGFDNLSKSLLKFKDALPQDIYAWIDVAVQELEKTTTDHQTIVMRVLHSHETAAHFDSNTSLDQLGKAIAAKFKSKWLPHLITKSHPTERVKYLSLEKRKAVLANVYSLSKDFFEFNGRQILLIDDILTTGTTVLAIIQLIREYFPGSRFNVFTLARSAYDLSLNRRADLQGDHYLWNDEHWQVAEEAGCYASYDYVKARILNDQF